MSHSRSSWEARAGERPATLIQSLPSKKFWTGQKWYWDGWKETYYSIIRLSVPMREVVVRLGSLLSSCRYCQRSRRYPSKYQRESSRASFFSGLRLDHGFLVTRTSNFHGYLWRSFLQTLHSASILVVLFYFWLVGKRRTRWYIHPASENFHASWHIRVLRYATGRLGEFFAMMNPWATSLEEQGS